MTHLLIVFSLSPTKPMSGTARGETQKNKREASSENYTEFNDRSIQPRTMTAKMTVPSAAKTPMLRGQRAHCLFACACGRARERARPRPPVHKATARPARPAPTRACHFRTASRARSCSARSPPPTSRAVQEDHRPTWRTPRRGRLQPRSWGESGARACGACRDCARGYKRAVRWIGRCAHCVSSVRPSGSAHSALQ